MQARLSDRVYTCQNATLLEITCCGLILLSFQMNELELCPDCYLNSCIRKDDYWFSEPCVSINTVLLYKLSR